MADFVDIVENIIYLKIQRSNFYILLTKEMSVMKTLKETTVKAVVSIVKKNLKVDANSTSCVVAYQPKAPAALKQFSKVNK